MRDFSRVNDDAPQPRLRNDPVPVTDEERTWARERGLSEEYVLDLKRTTPWGMVTLDDWLEARRAEAERQAFKQRLIDAERQLQAEREAKAKQQP